MNRSFLLLVLAVTITLAGCSGVRQTVDGWFGETPAPAPAGAQAAGDPYFAAAADLPVFAEASSSSKVVGHLALHEKVIRTRLDRGYAYVTAERGGLSGWVDNAQLVWRLAPSGSGASTLGIDPTRQGGGAANAGKDATVESEKAVAEPEPPATAAPTPTAEVSAPATSVPDTPVVAVQTATSIPPTPAAPPTATARSRQAPSMFDPF